MKRFCSGGSMQRHHRSSGSCTSPVWAEPSWKEGIIESPDRRDQILSVTRFKKPEQAHE